MIPDDVVVMMEPSRSGRALVKYFVKVSGVILPHCQVCRQGQASRDDFHAPIE
jgi:hypothetical protein